MTTTSAMPTSAATTATTAQPASSPAAVSQAAVKAPAATGMSGKVWHRTGWVTLIAGGIIGLGMFGFLAWHGSITQGNSNPAPIVNTGPGTGGVESNLVTSP